MKLHDYLIFGALLFITIKLKTMAKNTGEIKQALTEQGAALDDLQTTLDDVQTKLQDLIDNGDGATQEELQELRDLVSANSAKITAIKTDLQSTVPSTDPDEPA